MAPQVNNKAILKNSLMLYIRMLILMVVNFLSVRIILNSLGIEDYGIYNVVGGVVAMFQFLQGSLTTASQRYFSMEIACGSEGSLNRVFSLNITIFMLLGIVVILLSEGFGVWFVNHKLIIPASRLGAANIVFQLSILSFVLNLISIPYNALIISYERMSAFAWLGLCEGILKLGLVSLLLILPGDRLIEYAVIMTLLTVGITLAYILYCHRRLQGSHYRFFWDKKEAGELFSFAGWHFLGTFSVVVRSTGVNLLLNTFFNPVVNAGRAIGYQIESVVSQFSNNFFTAVKPQMYKAYSKREMDDLFDLINRSTILSMYLISILAFPLMLNIDFVLKLWLGELPPYASAFGTLALINCLIEATASPTIAPALAHGKIRNFEIGIAIVACLNLPVSYLALKLGCQPQTTVVISIILSIVAIFVRVFFLKKMMQFHVKPYLIMLLKTAIVSVVSYGLLSEVGNQLSSDIARLILIALVGLVVITSGYLIVLSKKDRCAVISFLRMKLKI